MGDFIRARRSARPILATLMLLIGAIRAEGMDTYTPTTRELQIPALSIGAATYSNVVLSVGSILSGPSGATPAGTADTYSPTSNQLTVPTVIVGSNVYLNAVVSVAQLISIGSVSGADSYDGSHLFIPAIQVGSKTYTNVVLAVSTANITAINSGMPQASLDRFDAATGTLNVAAVQVGARVYTNVVLHAGTGDIVCVGCTPPAASLDLSVGFLSGGSATVQATAAVQNLGSQTVTQYSWAWGDGSTSVTSGGAASHAYGSSGTFTATVSAKLASGQTVPATQSVRIVTPPVATDYSSIFPGYGTVIFQTPDANPIVAATLDMTVPAAPPPSGTLFSWPGLEPSPSASGFLPIGEGVLQPVLTWGLSCAPTTQPAAYSTWWISGQYVNTLGSDPGYEGCFTGAAIQVGVGDTLHITMTLASDGHTWQQQVVDQKTGQSASFNISLGGQIQNIFYLLIEPHSSEPTVPVYFNNVVITWQRESAPSCFPTAVGPTDSVAVPQLSTDGLSCTISRVILRGVGVAATAL